jgi:Alginate export
MPRFSRQPQLLRSLLVLLLLAAPASARAEWTLNDAIMPDGISLTVKHRSRYEFLDDEFRTRRNGDTDVVVFRTLVHGRVDLPFGLTAGAELEDSRAEQNSDTFLNTTIVNSVELLQGYLEYRRPDTCGGTLKGRGGRITMDVGSRRFVARNRFRNTINGFTGIDVEWKDESDRNGLVLRGFWTLPVLREPTTLRRDRLLDNDIVFDTETIHVNFWGLYAARDFDRIGRGELFLFGIHESDTNDRPTRNRQLATPGFRFYRKPAKGRFDYAIENAIQFGTSRRSPSNTSPAGLKELDHFAHFHHLTLAYTFDAPWLPRVALQYDFASGDTNPNDGSNGRFDTLYGARRFDFGPTGIYGPFARSNVHTPGVRVQVKPHARWSSFVAVRAFWLAADEDFWVPAGVVDPNGNSGSYVGSQIEMRVRFDVIPGNVRLEGGYAHLFAGEFIDDAPNSNDQGDSNYVYTQLSISF